MRNGLLDRRSQSGRAEQGSGPVIPLDKRDVGRYKGPVLLAACRYFSDLIVIFRRAPKAE